MQRLSQRRHFVHAAIKNWNWILVFFFPRVISTFIEFHEDDEENRLIPISALLKASERKKLLREIPYDHVVNMNNVREHLAWIPSQPSSPAPSSTNSYKRKLHRREEEMQIIASLVYNQQKSCSQILSHPVTRLFLNLKWNRLKYVVYANSALRILFYLLFLSLTFQIYFVDCPHLSAKNGSDDVVPQETFLDSPTCAWSPMTLSLLPIVTLANGAFIVSEILKIPLILNVSRFKTYWFGYLGTGAWTRMLFFSVAMLTSTTPLYQTRLHSFQYLVAVVSQTSQTNEMEYRRMRIY